MALTRIASVLFHPVTVFIPSARSPTASGQINANGASQAAFGSWSDVRLKENIIDLLETTPNIKY